VIGRRRPTLRGVAGGHQRPVGFTDPAPLTVAEDAGHSAGDPTITDTVVTATNRFAHT